MNVQYVQGDCIFTRVNKITKQYEYLTEDYRYRCNNSWRWSDWSNSRILPHKK